MEITEIVTSYINHIDNVIEVKFRINDDEDNEIRVDKIELSETEDFGFNIIIDDSEFYDDDIIGIEEDIDESELISFLNEYYVVYSDRLPNKNYY